uniref:Uncharacterized protein n=1 Tax=Setaria italica TaxID=4555 RepID=K3ZKV0_SETIT
MPPLVATRAEGRYDQNIIYRNRGAKEEAEQQITADYVRVLKFSFCSHIILQLRDTTKTRPGIQKM